MVRWLVGLGGGGDDDDVNRKCHPPPSETRGVKNEEELLSGQKTGSPSPLYYNTHVKKSFR